MTDKELNLAAKPRGHKSPIMLAAFRTGFTAACNGKTRDDHGLGDVPREIKAWQDGWDYLAESQRPPVATADERTIEIDGTTTPVTLHAIPDGGFEVLVPIGGQTVSAYGDTEEIALAAARDRLIAAAREAKARENDTVIIEFNLEVDVNGTIYEVIQRDYKSGRFDLRVATLPQITFDGTGDDDQDKALETIAVRIGEALSADDPIVSAESISIPVNGAEYQVVVQQLKSGAYVVTTERWPDMIQRGKTEDEVLDGLEEQIVARLDVEKARTVDSVPAIVKSGTKPPQLKIRTPAECAAEVHRCLTELAKRSATEEAAKTARKAAETALSIAYGAMLEAVDREAKPTLPLVPA
ncbi:MAG: hypothetical protein JWN27_2933 [Candidatus Eremiobacteraeota bacterium]|nr:hypothetical protein [Candidatus Eremiobacteraeota bacterium]